MSQNRDRCRYSTCEPAAAAEDARQRALDLHIAIGQSIPSVRPLFFLEAEDETGRPVFHTAVPTESLAALIAEAQNYRAEVRDLHAINQDLRRQRDEARRDYKTLRFLWNR